ncbi:methylated-DNA--[protein]-cysteine S-methyltransferase [Fructobacillus ficulneus]|uniref:methylated-DNA--[protein]-cysteine S-methyltransferase n=1 Tax=Fructobacillus ficulneus TaxID=157463 RepID=A0A0K8MIC7_9LACO|nr:methylated-DNA--[protein]-cysteine S-methyltransferase [Fructobacillus ficulneus]GAP00322.1 hypothetical protein FFIC_283390 [Fructobacillus ficulneus]
MLYTATYNSILGEIILVSDDEVLVGLWFQDQPKPQLDLSEAEVTLSETEPIRLARIWLDQYFKGENPAVDSVPIGSAGTAFRDAVRQELVQVPMGQRISYRDLSDALQKDQTVKANKSRAVGNAVGHNPILLLVPCHRVVGSDGSMTGYAGGLDRKRALLEMEEEWQG